MVKLLTTIPCFNVKGSLGMFLLFFIIGIAQAQESMTPERFRELVATSGDTNALRPELASLPFWRNAKCSVTLKYQDGKIFTEECVQTAKTIDGKYIVFSTDSKFYKQPMHAIAGYDENASAIRTWGLFGNTVTQATMIFDPEMKISACTATYAGGFMEISVGSYSVKEMKDHCLTYKDGVLFMTRDVRTWPITPGKKSEGSAALYGGKSAPATTNQN